jgi:UDP-3-O-[3-hydroxymyristoyl] glucosamine N-acyltransferase
MILYDNYKPLLLIGYHDSTITQEAMFWYGQNLSEIRIISPNEFLTMEEPRENYQYVVAFTLDRLLRNQILQMILSQGLNLISYVHPTVVLGNDDPTTIVNRGCFVAPHSTLLLGSRIGIGTIIETYCLVSHHSILGNNVHLHSGVMIAGRVTIQDHCILNFRSTVLPKLDICENVEVGAASTVTKCITQPGKYVGTPCRRVSDIETI